MDGLSTKFKVPRMLSLMTDESRRHGCFFIINFRYTQSHTVHMSRRGSLDKSG